MSPKGNPAQGEKLNTIKDHLKKRGSSQRWLAEQTGIHFTTIAAFANQQRQPSLTDLKKISDALGVKMVELIHQGE